MALVLIHGQELINRWLMPKDMDDVLGIDFHHDPLTECWSRAEWKTHLEERSTIGRVITDINDRIYSFYVYQLQPMNIQILNFAVHPKFLRQGIGNSSINDLEFRALNRPYPYSVTINIPERAVPLQLLLNKRNWICQKSTGPRANRTLHFEFNTVDRTKQND